VIGPARFSFNGQRAEKKGVLPGYESRRFAIRLVANCVDQLHRHSVDETFRRKEFPSSLLYTFSPAMLARGAKKSKWYSLSD
jgi:hypothetical protein